MSFASTIFFRINIDIWKVTTGPFPVTRLLPSFLSGYSEKSPFYPFTHPGVERHFFNLSALPTEQRQRSDLNAVNTRQ